MFLPDHCVILALNEEIESEKKALYRKTKYACEKFKQSIYREYTEKKSLYPNTR